MIEPHFLFHCHIGIRTKSSTRNEVAFLLALGWVSCLQVDVWEALAGGRFDGIEKTAGSP
jgi:hypothetical protein